MNVPIVIIDLKGDQALHNAIKSACQKAGRVCRSFTLEVGRVTSHFECLNDIFANPRRLIESVEMLLNALSLAHGSGYGRSYYTEQSRSLLLNSCS